MRWVGLLLFGVGCGFSAPNVTGDASTDGDTGPCEAWDTRGGHVRNVCATPRGASWRVDTLGATYDTDDGTYSAGTAPRSYLIEQPGNRMLRVVSVQEFNVGENASLRVVGQHPILVLSWSTITIAGMIDVSSQAVFSRPGAGGSRQDCDLGDTGQGTSEAGGGGGGGLSQGGKDGGAGNLMGTQNRGGTLGGSTPRLMGIVFGGCRGGDGGGDGGRGGDGGGAVQLTARDSINIISTGRIHAGGMGGAGAPGNGGGGGGGSGGFIGLDAPLVTTAAGSIVAANGGAGGAGCESGPGTAGQDGQLMNARAIGGPGSSCTNGADGGTGGRRGDFPVAGAPSNFSGGGGGGGAGYVIVWTPSTGYTIDGPGTRSPREVHVTDDE